MAGKIVRFDDETFALINLLRRERHRSFQQLADEAFSRPPGEAWPSAEAEGPAP